jgi:alkylhydroperoxidase family enzyme
VCSLGGTSEAKILALQEHASSPLFDDTEKAALAYADAVTLSDRDVGDDLFARLRSRFSEDQIIELTAVIAWENASSKFNRALRIGAQGLWRRVLEGAGPG